MLNRINLERCCKIIFVSVVISVLTYLPMLANGLTNAFDGLWASTYAQAGNWEISLGRFVWPFLDKIRGGYGADPLNSVLTLTLMATGGLVLFSIFEWKNSYILFLIYMLISTTTCNYLSYRFQSPTFGAAFLFAVLAGWMLVIASRTFTNKKVAYCGAVVMLVLALGCYQANLSCFMLLFIAYAMKKLLEDDKTTAITTLVHGFIVTAVSCVLYKILWEIALRMRHISTADYKGAGNSSVIALIAALPINIGRSFLYFIAYHADFNDYYGSYVFIPIRYIIYIAVLVTAIVIGVRKLKQDKSSLILYILLFCSIMIVANVYQFLLVEQELPMIQMTMGDLMVMPLLLVIIDEFSGDIIKRMVPICAIVLLYGNAYAVGTDVAVMQEGTTSSQTVMNSITASLIDEGLYSDKYSYAFVGNLSDNPLFKKSGLWEKASPYAQVGNSWADADSLNKGYAGILDDMGLNLSLLSYEEYEEILYSSQAEALDIYPAEGSIVKSGNTIIIKVSDIPEQQ